MATKYNVYGTHNGEESIIAVAFDMSIVTAILRGLIGSNYTNVRYESNERKPKRMYFAAVVHDVSGTAVRIAIATDSTQDAASINTDLRTAAAIVTRYPLGAIRLHDTKPIKSVTGWTPVSSCTTNGEPWAWVQ